MFSKRLRNLYIITSSQVGRFSLQGDQEFLVNEKTWPNFEIWDDQKIKMDQDFFFLRLYIKTTKYLLYIFFLVVKTANFRGQFRKLKNRYRIGIWFFFFIGIRRIPVLVYTISTDISKIVFLLFFFFFFLFFVFFFLNIVGNFTLNIPRWKEERLNPLPRA